MCFTSQKHSTTFKCRCSTNPQPLQLYSPDAEEENSAAGYDKRFDQTILATIPGIIPSQGLTHLPHAPGEHKQNISRRTVVASLTGLAVVGISGGAITWLVRAHRHTTPATTPPPTPARSPTPTPIPIGTTFHTYRGHHNIVAGVAWSPNGTLIASASADKTVQVWDVDTGGVNVSIDTGHTDIVTCVAWSPDNKLVVSGSADKTARVWNYADNSHPVTYNSHSDVVNSVAWSPDGSLIASGSADKTVQV